MTGIAEPLDDLRIALGEVDTLAMLTRAAYDSADWSESDPAIAELLDLFKRNNKVLSRSDDDVIAAMTRPR